MIRLLPNEIPRLYRRGISFYAFGEHPLAPIKFHALTGVVFFRTPSALRLIPPRPHGRGSLEESCRWLGLMLLHTFREAEGMDLCPWPHSFCAGALLRLRRGEPAATFADRLHGTLKPRTTQQAWRNGVRGAVLLHGILHQHQGIPPAPWDLPLWFTIGECQGRRKSFAEDHTLIAGS